MHAQYAGNKMIYEELKNQPHIRSVENKSLFDDIKRELSKKTDHSVSKGNVVDETNPQFIHKTTYGEVEIDGMERLMCIIRQNNIQVFIDIGSGCGKFPIMCAFLQSIKLSVGFELVKERHDIAVKNAMLVTDNKIYDKIKLINSNMLNVNYRDLITRHTTRPIMVWISNLCFTPEVNDSLFEKLILELPKGSIIACSKEPTDKTKLTPYEFRSNQFNVQNGTGIVPMTWCSESTVYVYGTN